MNQSRWPLVTLIASTVVGSLLVVLMFAGGNLLGPPQQPEPNPGLEGPTNPQPPPPPDGPPRLAILLVFDQLRADYLTRWDSLFQEGGFHRLEREGVWFQNCHYPYALTVTGPGHASLATGCSPDRHGIVSNGWFDHKVGSVYCAGDARWTQVPPAPESSSPGLTPRGSGSPQWLLAETLSDSLKKATRNQGRVVSLSAKDRSACLPGGQKPDACYWFETSTGTFVTSNYYTSLSARGGIHSWVAAFNAARPADRYFNTNWTHFQTDVDYVRWSGPDDVLGEGSGFAQGRVFPHPMTGGLSKPGPKSYEALYNSPFGNELLLDLVKKAIDAEHLGGQETLDLLCVSFSCNDPVGHTWGPDSQEVLDTTLRTDRLIKDLLDFLDSHVGKGRYTIVLSADHGVCPLPEIAPGKDQPPRRRILERDLQVEAEEFLRRVFPGPDGKVFDAVIKEQTPVFYLNRAWMEKRGLSPAEAENALGGWLAQRPETLTFYTRTRLEKGIPATDVLGQRVLKSFHKGRSGDVFLVTRPYHLLWSETGTSHGTPHDYDTHVPLLVFGPGVVPSKRETEFVTPQAAAPILARALGVPPPRDAEAVVPDGVFRGQP